jgi:hypothetical protein
MQGLNINFRFFFEFFSRLCDPKTLRKVTKNMIFQPSSEAKLPALSALVY